MKDRLGWAILYEPELHEHQLEVFLRNISNGEWVLVKQFENKLVAKVQEISRRFLWWKWVQKQTYVDYESPIKSIQDLRRAAVQYAQSLKVSSVLDVKVVEYAFRSYARLCLLGVELSTQQTVRDCEGIIWNNGCWADELPQRKEVSKGNCLCG